MVDVKVPYEECQGSQADKLRFIRACLNITPAELATIARASTAVCYNWESTSWQHPISYDSAKLITDHIGVPVEWLKPCASHKRKYSAFAHIRRSNLLDSLWPSGDQPADEEELKKRVTAASFVIPKEIVRTTFLRYYLENADKKDLASETATTVALVSRNAAESLNLLRNSQQAQRLLMGEENHGPLLSDPLIDLLELRPCYKVRLMSFGIRTIGDLVTQFSDIIKRKKISKNLVNAVMTVLENHGFPLELEEKENTDPAPKDNFSVLYDTLYPKHEISKEEALARVEKALEHLTVRRSVAIFKNYYIGGRTATNIALEYHLTRERIRQIINKVLALFEKNPACQKIIKGQEYSPTAISIDTSVYALGIPSSTAENLHKHGIRTVGHIVESINKGSIKRVWGFGSGKIDQVTQILEENGIRAVFGSLKHKRKKRNIRLLCTATSIATVLGIDVPTVLEKAETEKWQFKADTEGEPRKYTLSDLPPYVEKAFGRIISVQEISIAMQRNKGDILLKAQKEKWPYVEIIGQPGRPGKYQAVAFPLDALPKHIRKKIINESMSPKNTRRKKKVSSLFTTDELAMIKIMRMNKIHPDYVIKQLLNIGNVE